MGIRFDAVNTLVCEYQDLPFEVLFKEDLLRVGLAFSADALSVASGYKPKAYFIFSFDLVPISELSQGEHLRAPEEIALVGGRLGFRRVIVSVRLNPASPYCVDLSEDGRLILRLEGEEVCEVAFQKTPEYYLKTLANGKPITDIAPTIEWGYLLYLTVFRICQYFGRKEECQFCDINENYRQQKKSGRSYTTVKSIDEILEALGIINATDTASAAYTVTGGSITGQLNGMSEVEFYAQYPRAIERRFPGRWISKIVVQALPRDEAMRLHDAGAQIYHPNYEIWDERLFNLLCPGKSRQIGHGEWLKRIIDAAEVFGPRNVIPNFVAGIEMARPHGFTCVEDAIRSTSEGLDFFMSQGIVPRFTTWCPEPMTTLGKANREGAPLEYHARLLRSWREILIKHGLPAPPGYGPPGIGQGVFSVSSFMDVAPV